MSNNLAACAVSIIDVQLAFEQWRSQRKKRHSTPTNLRTLALLLLDEHAPVVVCKALGINNAALKQWQAAQTPPPEQTDFVSLPSQSTSRNSNTNPSGTIHITLPNGIHLNLPCNEMTIALAIRSANSQSMQA
jgi:hypothetical protein